VPFDGAGAPLYSSLMRTSFASVNIGLVALLGTAAVHARLPQSQPPTGARPAVAMGPVHTVAIRTDGTVLVWGDNDKGQLGSGTLDAVNVRREPAVLPGVSGAVAAAAGEKFALVLLADGSVMSWGDNSEGQLGLGPAGVFPRPGQAMPPVPVPSRVPGLTGVRQIAAGLRFALALREDGTVVAWGDGRLGALGDGKGTGSGSHYAVPFPRPVIGLSNVVGIAAGSEFGLALRADGSVWGWGANEYGQMGDDAVDFKATPVRLAGVTNVRTLHGAGRTGLALLNDGTVEAWGKNECGLFGVPNTKLAKSAKPVPIGGLTRVRQLGTNSTACHALAVLDDGTVRAWGDNSYAELSNGPRVDGLVTVPIQVTARST
jgi:alpha-tubulin suppressor-like RCC1 family protein